ncbi:MAG: hypothetical protein JSS98_01165 [Bacteroidetes bacterium]|nr:hypothetical protein [Bacteroidota bacterium]
MKKILLILLFFSAAFSMQAQDVGGNRQEKIEALKIAFITQKLQLTPSEAEKFWPLYNQYNEEVKGLSKNPSSNDVLENEQQLLNVRKKYRASFEKVLGPQKMNNLFNAERDFRNVLIKRLKARNQQRNR